MARKTGDSCMFCGASPCECGKPKKPAVVAKKPPTTKPVTITPVPTTPSVPTVDPTPTTSPLESTGARKNLLSGRKRAFDEGYREHSDAVIALMQSFQLDPRDIARNRHMIDLPDWKIEAHIWKGRNARERDRRRTERHRETGA